MGDMGYLSRGQRSLDMYPLAAPPSRVVMEEVVPDRFWAEKGAVHDLVKILMHFQKEWHWGKGLRTSPGRPEIPIVQPQGFGTRWRSPLEPDPLCDGNATLPKECNAAESSSPEDSSSPSNATIDI